MTTKRLLALLLSLSLCFSLLAGCGKQNPDPNDPADTGNDTTEETVCAEHIDADADGGCDNCGVEVKTVCQVHMDLDYDNYCDNCYALLATPCEAHADNDNDGYCDYCDEFLGFVCLEHTDANADGCCDNCSGPY